MAAQESIHARKVFPYQQVGTYEPGKKLDSPLGDNGKRYGLHKFQSYVT